MGRATTSEAICRSEATARPTKTRAAFHRGPTGQAAALISRDSLDRWLVDNGLAVHTETGLRPTQEGRMIGQALEFLD